MKVNVQHYVMLRLEETIEAANLSEAAAHRYSDSMRERLNRMVRVRPGFTLVDFGTQVELVSQYDTPQL